ncbi:MAG TPA: hypothetical protein VFP21_10210 [Solirubrobacterales bacterium]|nr:hypothetical protein [Solirubrobacterales bacterium]
MQTMEIGSTDKRIDDLNDRVSEGFQRVDLEIKELRRETHERFTAVDARLDSMNARFDAMHRTMMRGFFAIGGITVTLFLALAGLQGF